jgi:hypothetical protein
MPCPSLTAALAALTDLQRLRKSLAAEQSATVRGEDPRRALVLQQIGVDRINVERAIRDALDLVTRLLAERVRAANPRAGS